MANLSPSTPCMWVQSHLLLGVTAWSPQHQWVFVKQGPAQCRQGCHVRQMEPAGRQMWMRSRQSGCRRPQRMWPGSWYTTGRSLCSRGRPPGSCRLRRGAHGLLQRQLLPRGARMHPRQMMPGASAPSSLASSRPCQNSHQPRILGLPMMLTEAACMHPQPVMLGVSHSARQQPSQGKIPTRPISLGY